MDQYKTDKLSAAEQYELDKHASASLEFARAALEAKRHADTAHRAAIAAMIVATIAAIIAITNVAHQLLSK